MSSTERPGRPGHASGVARFLQAMREQEGLRESFRHHERLPAQAAAEVKRLAIEVFRAVDCAGMARVDFLMDGKTGKVYVNEINTIPGFTTISMYSKMWAASGVPYAVLLDRLIALALERHTAKQQLRTSM